MLMQTVYDEPEERQDRTLVPVHVDMAGFDPVWVSVSTEEAWDAIQENRPAQEELAWAAGIIDGEGCILAEGMGAHQRPRITLTVSNQDAAMVQRLHALFGGWLGARDRRGHCVRWGTSGPRAGRALQMVLPYLVTKAWEAVLAIDYAATSHKGKPLSKRIIAYRQEIGDQLRAAKRRY